MIKNMHLLLNNYRKSNKNINKPFDVDEFVF